VESEKWKESHQIRYPFHLSCIMMVVMESIMAGIAWLLRLEGVISWDESA
jgi:hypothetical protein